MKLANALFNRIQSARNAEGHTQFSLELKADCAKYSIGCQSLYKAGKDLGVAPNQLKDWITCYREGRYTLDNAISVTRKAIETPDTLEQMIAKRKELKLTIDNATKELLSLNQAIKAELEL